VFGNPTCVDEGVLRNMGDEALGVYSASWYSAALDTPENMRFVQAVLAEYKVVPGFYTAGTYVSGMYLESALNAIKGRFEDKPAFVRALHDVRLERSPMGPIRIDEYASRSSTSTCARWSARRPPGELHRRHLPRGDAVLELRPGEVPRAPGYSRDSHARGRTTAPVARA